jgi:hypothetical protein
VGDIVSVLVNKFPDKPEFLRSSSASRVNDSKTKEAKQLSRKTSEFVQQSSEPALPDLTEQDLLNLEVSDGSYVQFYLNGVRQQHSF